MVVLASTSPTIWDYVAPVYHVADTANEGAHAFNNAIWIVPLVLKLIWLLFLIPIVFEFIDALRRPEYRFPGSTGSSKTLWLVALAASFIVPISWFVAPLYLFRVVLRGRDLADIEVVRKIPVMEPPSRPFK